MMGRIRLISLYTIVAFVLVAAACNGDDPSDTAQAATSATSASETSTSTSTSQAITTSNPPPSTTAVNASGCTAEPTVEQQLGELIGFVSGQLMPEYQIARHDLSFTNDNCWHIWDSDDCSVPVGEDTQVAQDFVHPCHRHDFGYRNYKRIEEHFELNVWNEPAKLGVDGQFLEDMREVCASRSLLSKHVCLGWAQVFYWAVRAFGGFRDSLLDG